MDDKTFSFIKNSVAAGLFLYTCVRSIKQTNLRIDAINQKIDRIEYRTNRESCDYSGVTGGKL